MALGSGILPKDPQRAAGRFEINGGVEDYYTAAVRNITSTGSVIVLMDGAGAERNEAAAKAVGLWIHHRLDVAPRPRQPATYSISVARAYAAERQHSQHAMRGATGIEWSPWYKEIRKELDLPV